MIKEASYSILNILGFNARFYFCDLDLDPGDEVKDSSSRPLPSLEHFSSTSRSLERVSLIPWTVTPSSSGLGFLFQRLFLAGTYIHSSSLGEAVLLFISGVLLTSICAAVWQPSSLTLLTLWAHASFTSLPRAFPS